MENTRKNLAGAVPDTNNPSGWRRSMASPSDYNNRVRIHKDKTDARRFGYLTILLFASPPAWTLLITGIILVAAGIAVHGWAAGYLARAGYAEREKILTVRGPYRHNRNPYYIAHMTMDLGFFFLAGRPLFFLFYFPVIFFIYRRWVLSEERFLESEFGEAYRVLKQSVPRWRFRLTPAPPCGSDLAFKWSTFMVNRELPRALSHICWLIIFLLIFALGNPFSQMTVLARITLIAAIAGWFVVRDIYALDVSRKSIGWFIFAGCVIAITTIFLIHAPVWEPWLGTAAWIATALGLCLGLLVCAAVLPDVGRTSGRAIQSFYARPICQWYLLAMSLGLLSGTLGGVWLGIMVLFTAWALQFSGALSIPPVPRRLSVSFALLVLIGVSVSFAVARQLI
jgi:Phospholipid methyltransferase